MAKIQNWHLVNDEGKKIVLPISEVKECIYSTYDNKRLYPRVFVFMKNGDEHIISYVDYIHKVFSGCKKANICIHTALNFRHREII